MVVEPPELHVMRDTERRIQQHRIPPQEVIVIVPPSPVCHSWAFPTCTKDSLLYIAAGISLIILIFIIYRAVGGD